MAKRRRAQTFPAHGMRRITQAVALTILAGALTACDRSPTVPTPPVTVPNPPVTNPPPAPTTPSVVRVEVGGPATIPPGESIQLTLTAVLSDGSVKDVTGAAVWRTSNDRVLEISAAGVARGLAVGEADVIARHEAWSGTMQVLVLPAGTHRLTGRVSVGGIAIRDVTMEVVSGVGAGLTAITTPDGGYAFYGVSGSIRIHLKKAGYGNRIAMLDVAGDRTFDLELVPERPVANLSGTYALTIAAAPCRFGQLPEAARNRVYTATVSQDNFRLHVRLTGADFIIANSRGDKFSGFVDPTGLVTFAIVGDTVLFNDPYYHFVEHDLAERFETNRTLLVSGIVTAHATPSGISGLLSGAINVAQGVTYPLEPDYEALCPAEGHRFDMQRQ